MRKSREPTAEERRLWREVTKHDEKLRLEAAMEDEAVSSESIPEPMKMPVAAVAKPRKTSTLPPLKILSGRETTRVLKTAGPVQGVLDLHGIGRVEAYGMVQDFVAHVQQSGKRHVLIITGKGRASEGVLRAQLPHWLNEPGMRARVSAFAHPPANKGGSGVLHVVVKRS